jgi:hypothetical protein
MSNSQPQPRGSFSPREEAKLREVDLLGLPKSGLSHGALTKINNYINALSEFERLTSHQITNGELIDRLKTAADALDVAIAILNGHSMLRRLVEDKGVPYVETISIRRERIPSNVLPAIDQEIVDQTRTQIETALAISQGNRVKKDVTNG